MATVTGQLKNNSNATKMCKKCGNIPTQGPKCVQCNAVFHPGCIKYLKDVVEIAPGEVMCCGSKVTPTTLPEKKTTNSIAQEEVAASINDPDNELDDESFSSAIENSDTAKVENKYQKKLLKENDLHIKSLCANLDILHKQITLLNNIIIKQEEGISNNHDPETTSQEINEIVKNSKLLPSKNTNDKQQKKTQDSPSNQAKTPNQGDKDKKVKKTLRGYSELQEPVQDDNENLDNNKTLQNEDDNWNQVKRKKRHRRESNKPIIGCSVDNSTLKAVPRRSFIHVYRLNPSTTAKDIEDHLCMSNICTFRVVKLQSRYPNLYSSFKVTIDHKDQDVAMKPETWPPGSCINRIFHRILKKTALP
ncbi:hypothetical protein Zmor_024414 [Zophobas morio]|uniref:Uncharacterized protein n=1 Tax=Zophobas morio TaxID=2755281 RepID=A0AA38I0J0_9CUCU|nr:hypothetical protein Zmor_024414 [Zophobas morio]